MKYLKSTGQILFLERASAKQVFEKSNGKQLRPDKRESSHVVTLGGKESREESLQHWAPRPFCPLLCLFALWRKKHLGTSLVVNSYESAASKAEDAGSVPGQETK